MDTSFVFPDYRHLEKLTTDLGLYEHSLLDEPRTEHGYCVDDAARAVVILSREPNHDARTTYLLGRYLDFTTDAIESDGRIHNRMNNEGVWIDQPGTGDWWGRAIWGLGFGAVHSPSQELRKKALAGYQLLVQNMTSDLKSLSFAALGAGELLLYGIEKSSAGGIIEAAKDLSQPNNDDKKWLWPEPRLRYGNGATAEAVILAGWNLMDRKLLKRGLDMLGFLVEVETYSGHFSPTPIYGRGPENSPPGFDQQPIEIAAIADACARAWEFTGNPKWLVEVDKAWNWFLGHNDNGAVMIDIKTGGGYDGLNEYGVNKNQGAESTIAMLSTAQRASELRGLIDAVMMSQ